MPESCWTNFLTRTGLVQHWTDFCGRLTLQGLQTGSLAAAEKIQALAQETCKCLCKWRPLSAQTVTDGIAYELQRRLFHIGNLCFWVPFFKQLLLKNCAVDFVEICNVCTRKVIIKDAKRTFNSDKICGSNCDFYFGVTFFGTHCIRAPAVCIPWLPPPGIWGNVIQYHEMKCHNIYRLAGRAKIWTRQWCAVCRCVHLQMQMGQWGDFPSTKFRNEKYFIIYQHRAIYN